MNLKKSLLLTMPLAALCAHSQAVEKEKQSKPNVILILADDMGYAGLSCFGGQGLTTPTLDKLAEQGIKCTNFHANAPVRSPTRVSILTGCYQQRAGLNSIYSESNAEDGLDPATESMLPRVMKAAGYKTAIFGKWHLGLHERFNPTYFGFDEFRGFLKGNIDLISHYNTSGQVDWWHNREQIDEPGYATTLINNHAVDFIRRNADSPFFLYVSHGAIHVPLLGPNDEPLRSEGVTTYRHDEQMDTAEYRRRYREMVYSIDEGVAMIMAELDRQNIRDNTLVIFISDNGGEKVAASKYPGSNGIYYGHKGQLYEGGIRVPGIFYYPGKIKSGQASDQVMMSMDLMPTIYHYCGIKNPNNIDGVNLSPVLSDGKQLAERPLFWANGRASAMLDQGWKLVMTGNKIELFNLAEDVRETTDLSTDPSQLQRVAKMKKSIVEWWDNCTRDTRLSDRTVTGKKRSKIKEN